MRELEEGFVNAFSGTVNQLFPRSTKLTDSSTEDSHRFPGLHTGGLKKNHNYFPSASNLLSSALLAHRAGFIQERKLKLMSRC